MLDRYPINSASSIAQAIELITADITNPTELNAIGTAVEDLRLVHENVAGSDRATWYRLDTSSDAVAAPYIMASATAGLRWVAIGGYATNQAMRIASTLAVGAGLTASSNVSVGGSLAVTSTATLSGLTTVIDGNFTIIGSVDSTKKLAFEVDAQTAGKKLTIDTGAQTVDRTLTVPVLAGNDTIAALAVAQVFSGANRFSNATTASSSITGALIIGDGVTTATCVGIGGGKIFTGGNVTCGGTLAVDIASSAGFINCLADDGQQAWIRLINRSGLGGAFYRPAGSTDVRLYGFGAAADLFAFNTASASTGNLSVQYTTDSTSTVSGAIVVSGGIGVAKRLTLDGSTGKTLRITNAVANGAVAVTLGAGPTGSTAGNPQGWMRIDIAGTDRYMPFW